MEQQLFNSCSIFKADRKTIEKNRRNQMKALYMKLNSLIPHDEKYSREIVSLPDQLEEAANYIKKLQIELERMRLRKESLAIGGGRGDQNSSSIRSNNGVMIKEGLPLPHIEIHHHVDSALEVVLITGLDYQFMFNAIIWMLHEEGIEVINASYTIIGDTIFNSIHSKVGECARGYRAARVSERLKKFVGYCATLLESN